MKTINYRRVAIWGVVLYLLNSLFGNILYLNPIVSDLYARYEGHPTLKPMSDFGGMGSWLMLNQLFGLAFFTLFIGLYLLLYRSLPGQGWQKGLFYGLMIGVVKAVPEAFNQWMLFVYPGSLILVQLINTLLSLLVLGLLAGFFFERFHVIEHEAADSPHRPASAFAA